MTTAPTTALITGATSGIGRATAVLLASRGMHVLVHGRDAARGDAVVERIRADGGKADFLACDLADAEAVRDLARQAGRVDVLVNNAATMFPGGPTASATADGIDLMHAINVRAPFLLVTELAPAMAARGEGAIVNVLSMAARFGLTGMACYGASKAALGLLTKSWAAEFGPSGVRVNAVSPGPTRTEGTAVFGPGLDELASPAPAGRVAAPEEIAASIAFLAGPEASFVQGVVLDVDGGRVAVG